MSPGDKHFPHKGGGTFLHTGEDKHFYTKGVQYFTQGGEQTFSVGGGDYDVNGHKEEDVSEVNIFTSKASKLSAGARMLGAQRALKS